MKNIMLNRLAVTLFAVATVTSASAADLINVYRDAVSQEIGRAHV